MCIYTYIIIYIIIIETTLDETVTKKCCGDPQCHRNDQRMAGNPLLVSLPRWGRHTVFRPPIELFNIYKYKQYINI